jgi:beta-glucosidase
VTTQTSDRLAALLRRLDLSTKIRLISGASMWSTAEAAGIGLRGMTLSDGPVGVRGPLFAENRVSAALPSPTGLAASWDEDLLRRVGETLAAEAERQGVDVVLGPTINLHRSPLGGRHFECLSEDPHLTARLASAYVRGVQAKGVGACPKHYVANDAETDRTTVDNRVDDRALRELYLAPFESVVADADPWMIMSAYNGTNGAPMSENPLLAEPLKGIWGWEGVVVSDWGGVYSTIASARGGNDLAMPGPDTPWSGVDLLDAVRAGEVDESAIDDKVLRLLRLAGRVGALGEQGPARDAVVVDPAHAAPLAREAAVEGTVLLRNDGVLPLRREALRSVALLGPSAMDPRPQGGGSAMVFPPYVVTPHAALREALGEDVQILTANGAPLDEALRPPHTEEVDETRVRWLGPHGELLADEPVATAWLYRSFRSVHPGAVTLEIRTRFLPSADGEWHVGVSGVGSFELELAGETVLTEMFVRERQDMNAVSAEPPQASVPVVLRRGKALEVLLRYRWMEDVFIFSAGLGVREPRVAAEEEIARAAELAARADVALVVVGTSEKVESEGFDRRDLLLPGRQDDLVAAVAQANPRTVVVVNAGAPVEMPWRDQVAAVLVVWFPGMELGHALVDVLLGDAEPGGRLPTTWPVDLEHAPVTVVTPTNGRLTYDEGLHIGHRAYLRDGVRPAYWFGHGLGYTTWTYQGLAASPTGVTVWLRNDGDRAGKEVVQAYVHRPDSELDRPERVLAGFAVVRAEPGEIVEVDVAFDPRTLRHWDVDGQRWEVEPGRLAVDVGPHAGNLPLRAETSLA